MKWTRPGNTISGADELNEPLETDFLSFAELLDGRLHCQRTENSFGLQERLGVLWSSRMALVACIGSALSRPDKAYPVEQVEAKIWRASIQTAIVQGIAPLEHLIASATYAQACAVLRQEVEAVEALRGLRSGHQRPGQTPRLKALRHLGRAYSQLSGITHLSSPRELIHVTSVIGSGLDHEIIPDFEEYLFSLHLTALVGLGLDIAEFRPYSETEYQSEQERSWMQCACGVLSERGFLSVS